MSARVGACQNKRIMKAPGKPCPPFTNQTTMLMSCTQKKTSPSANPSLYMLLAAWCSCSGYRWYACGWPVGGSGCARCEAPKFSSGLPSSRRSTNTKLHTSTSLDSMCACGCVTPLPCSHASSAAAVCCTSCTSVSIHVPRWPPGGTTGGGGGGQGPARGAVGRPVGVAPRSDVLGKPAASIAATRTLILRRGVHDGDGVGVENRIPAALLTAAASSCNTRAPSSKQHKQRSTAAPTVQQCVCACAHTCTRTQAP